MASPVRKSKESSTVKSKSTSYPIVVKCLAKSTSHQTLFNTFKEFGKLINNGITIIKDKQGNSTGQAYINYVDEQAALTARARMNGMMLDGSRICIEEYKQKIITGISAASSNKFDYRPLTDCQFFIEGNCRNNQSCPFRHPINWKADPCIAWKQGTCKNLRCVHSHPKKTKEISQVRSTSKKTDLKENMHVEFSFNDCKQMGVVRWVGLVNEVEQIMAGVELNNEMDQGNDGELMGKRYFTCKKKHGHFILASKCKIVKTPSIYMTNQSSQLKDQRKDFICGYYLKNLCVKGEECEFVHPPYSLSYCWYYQLHNERDVKLCPSEVNKAIEKSFCNFQNNEITVQVDSFTQIVVNFDDLTNSKYNGCPATFRRISTQSENVAKNEPLATKWSWFWFNGINWNEYVTADGSIMSENLEKAFHMYKDDEKNGKYLFTFKRFNYEISFKEMLQRNLQTSTKRNVRRRPALPTATRPGVADIVPNSVVGFPPTWDSTVPSVGISKMKVSPDIKRKIEGEFFKTMGNSKFAILSIEEVCNKTLYTQFSLKKQLMEERDGKKVCEMSLWHGTENGHVESICHQNFDWRLYHTHAYGKGSYFARDSSYSHSFAKADSHGLCSMFYADVLVGFFTEGNKDHKRPPIKSGFTLYDSCVNNITNPSIYVIFEKDQVYPRYLLKYKRIVNVF